MISVILRFIYIGVVLSIFLILLLAFSNIEQNSVISKQNCDCSTQAPSENKAIKSSDSHHLAVLVPFRDRYEELFDFIPYISKFLLQQGKKFQIIIINQVDELRFNRGSLLNAGWKELSKEVDHIVLHDVDLLPLNSDLQYVFPESGPFHISAPHLHPRYHYPTFIGGILIIRRDHFYLVDGMSNQYWGWGLEDDEFYARLKEAKLPVSRPSKLSTGQNDSFKHVHNRKQRPRDMLKCFNQQAVTRRRDRKTGLSTLQYNVVRKRQASIEEFPFTIIDVKLVCDFKLTPWCNCTENIGNSIAPSKNTLPHEEVDVIAPKINRRRHLTPDA